MVLILELKTSQTAAIKVLSDTLNSLLTDVNFVFYPHYIENDSDDSEVEEDRYYLSLYKIRRR